METKRAYRRSAVVRVALVGLALVGIVGGSAGAEVSGYAKDGEFHVTDRRPSEPDYKVLMRVRQRGRPAEAGAASKSDLDDWIMENAVKHGLPSSLIRAVIKAESGFNRHAVSPKGAQGLMQLMPETSDKMGVRDAFDRKQNISGGSAYLKEMLDRFHNLTLALAAYNAGPEKVVAYNGVPPYAETKGYIARVYRLYNRYRRQVNPHVPELKPTWDVEPKTDRENK
jgi:soluble lytic murein transglycosylase-like protein